MAGLPQFPISTQTDPYWEIPMYDAAGNPLSIEGRIFEAWIAPATTRQGVAEPVPEIKVLTFQDGLSLVPPTDGSGNQTVKNTLVHQISKDFAQKNFPRGELTADLLEVVDGARRLFAPVRLFYADPAQIREFVADRAGITFGPGRQPIVTPVAIAGQAGRRGSGFITGTLPPQPSDGEDGDYWIVDRIDQANVVYGPKEGGEWPAQPSSTLGVGGVADVPGLTEELPVRPQRFGGADDGSILNDTPVSAARGTGQTTALPRLSAGSYRFGDISVLDGMRVAPDLGVSIQSPGIAFLPDLIVSRNLPASFTVGDGDTLAYTYDYTPDHKRPRRERAIWTTPSDLDRETTERFIGVQVSQWLIANGTDNWIPSGEAADETGVSWTLAPDNLYRIGLLPARGGDAWRWSRSQAPHVGGICVRTTAGYYVFRAGPTAPALFQTKLIGQAATEIPGIDWPGRATDPAYAPGNAAWGVDILDSKRFTAVLNGMRVYGPVTVAGEIIEVGPMWWGDRNATVSAAYISRTRRSCEAAGTFMSLLCIGDSTTAPIHGGWPEVAVETIDAVRGIRVVALNNYAIGGQAAAEQLANLQSKGVPPGTTHAVVLLGRNNISGNAPAEDTKVSLSAILDILLAANVKPLVCVPFGAYTRAAAGGSGVAVVRSENAARTQMMIKSLAASKGCAVLDLNEHSGPAIGGLAHHAFAPSMWRDNLHESTFAYKVYGHAIANKLLAMTLEPMSPEVTEGALPANSLANVYGPLNNWTQGAVTLAYSISGAGRRPTVSLAGRLLPGTRAGAQPVYLLPPNLRPARQYTFLMVSDAPKATCVVEPSGIITLIGLGSEGSYVDLDGMSFPLA
jgi:hypothetical protein